MTTVLTTSWPESRSLEEVMGQQSLHGFHVLTTGRTVTLVVTFQAEEYSNVQHTGWIFISGFQGTVNYLGYF